MERVEGCRSTGGRKNTMRPLRNEEDDLKITSEYIARMANVSKATVSRVVNNNPDGVGEEVRERVKRVCMEYGYRTESIAGIRTAARTKTIGLVIPDIMNPFFPELVRSVEQRLSTYGYTVMLCNTDSSPEKELQIIKTLAAKRVDGVILASGLAEKHRKLEPCTQLGIPIVLVDRRTDGINSEAGIFIDNEYTFYQAADLLCRHGHRRILFLKGAVNMSTTQERFAGYCSALKQHGIDFDPSLVYQGDYGYQSGCDGVKQLFRHGTQFSAVLASNDMMALGALRALQELGLRVPDAVEVIGCDNIQFCEMVQPPLTTMRQPLEEMGRIAADTIVTLLTGKKPAERNIRLEASLVRRGSTKA